MNTTLTAPQFQAVCALIWGDGWRPAAADALGVSLRNVQFWAAEPPARCKPVPEGVARELIAGAVTMLREPAERERARSIIARHLQQLEILELITAPERCERLANR